MTDLPRVLIEASPCPACVVWRDPSESAECSACDHTGYLIPTTVSSPVRYEPGTQIEIAVADPSCHICHGHPRHFLLCSRCRASSIAVAKVEACSLLGCVCGAEREPLAYALSVSAVRPPTPEETT
jgi:hypothetical protein